MEDKTAYTHVRYDTAQVIIIDDPLSGREITEAEKAKLLEWWQLHSRRVLEQSFSMPAPRETCTGLTAAILKDLEVCEAAPKPRTFRDGPWYRQGDRRLDGRRRS
jgi:hypothetical protein